jgi:uncharacterized iron-regulated membrane protein
MTTTTEIDAGQEPAAPAPPPRRSRTRRVALRPRRLLVRVHRWLSIGLTVWFVVVAATGLTLIFADRLNHVFRPELYRSSSGDAPLADAIRAAERAVPGSHATYVAPAATGGEGVDRVSLEIPGEDEDAEPSYRLAFVDPGTAEVNGVRDEEAGFTWWMYRGHMYLWQDGGFLGLDGDDLVAWLAVVWMGVLLSGLYIWYWPGVRRWATALRVRRRRGRFTFNLDLHRATGIVVVVPLLVVSFTGAAFAFPAMRNLYGWATPAHYEFETWTPPDEATVSAEHAEDAEPLDADAVTALLEERYPDWTVEELMPPIDVDGTWSAWETRGFSPWTRAAGKGNTLVHVDQYTGRTTYVGTPEEGNAADQLWDDWSFPLHTGDFLGTPSRLAWLALAASPLVLLVTGLTMWFVRRSKRRRRAARAPATPAAAVSGP